MAYANPCGFDTHVALLDRSKNPSNQVFFAVLYRTERNLIHCRPIAIVTIRIFEFPVTHKHIPNCLFKYMAAITWNSIATDKNE